MYSGIAETHSGVVLFLGDRAYKFKKPVDLGFLDFRSLDARHRACEREIDLNRRLAPDVYLGKGELRQPGDTRAEPVVVMRRLPDDRRLSAVIDKKGDVVDHISRLARVIAEFHAGARRDEFVAMQGSSAGLSERWRQHLEELRTVGFGLLLDEEIDCMEEMALRYLAGRADLLDERIRRGWVCEGHGDLLADDIFCLDDGPRVLDCLDFNERLRFIDVLDDVASLVMDLERLGVPDIAGRFLACYDDFSGEVHPRSLQHHYTAYRASVRAKAAAIRCRQDGDRASEKLVHTLMRMALDHLDAGRVRLVLVGGLPGTGKSTVAQALGQERSWTVISSDVVRKELVGMAPESSAAAPWRTGLYDHGHTSLTYAALLQRASHALHRGESVVLDASWSDAPTRDMAAEVARAASADLVELQCVVDAPVAIERIARRYEGGGDASDATQQIARRMAEEAHAWPSAQLIDASYSIDESLAHVRSVVDDRLPEREGAPG